MWICPPWVCPDRHRSGSPSDTRSSAVRGPWASTMREPRPAPAKARSGAALPVRRSSMPMIVKGAPRKLMVVFSLQKHLVSERHQRSEWRRGDRPSGRGCRARRRWERRGRP